MVKTDPFCNKLVFSAKNVHFLVIFFFVFLLYIFLQTGLLLYQWVTLYGTKTYLLIQMATFWSKSCLVLMDTLCTNALRPFEVGKLLIGSISHLPQWNLPFSYFSNFAPNPLSFCIWNIKCIFAGQKNSNFYFRHFWLTFDCLWCKISLLQKYMFLKLNDSTKNFDVLQIIINSFLFAFLKQVQLFWIYYTNSWSRLTYWYMP